jgi:hypothetical protein
MEPPRIAILIPAFNEEKTIADVIQGALKFGDVFVVDDGSTDKTAEVAEKVVPPSCPSERIMDTIPLSILVTDCSETRGTLE